jgi:hypothetical protein
MGSATTNFLSIIEARSLGTADIDKMAAAIDKQTASLDGLTKHADKVNSHPGFNDFAGKIKQGLTDPIGAAEAAIQSAGAALGPFGQVIAGTVVTMGAMALAGFEAAKSLASYGREIENTGLRTGLTSKEVVQFGFAAKLVGQDVGVYERAMRGLTEALSDNSSKGDKAREALQKLGVVPHNLNGDLKSTGEIILDISAAMNRIPDAISRNELGMAVFKRSWIEIAPAILKVTEGVKAANEGGFFGPSKAELDKWDEYNRRVTTAEAKFDRFFRSVKVWAADNLLGDEHYWDKLHAQTTEGKAEALLNLPTKTPAINSFLLTPQGGAAMGAIQDDQAAGNALLSSSRNRMDSTLEGLRLKVEDAKSKYEEAYKSIRTLSDVSADAAQREIEKVSGLKKTYETLEQQLKLVEKAETARLAVLEKAEALRREGTSFYQFGEGPNAFFVTQPQMNEANIRKAGGLQPPSLFRTYSAIKGDGITGESPAGGPLQPDLAAGVQANGDFISLNSERTTGYLNSGVFAARSAGEAADRTSGQSSRAAIANAEADAVARMVELRAGPGGELAAARLVASLREQSLQREADQTLDIARYREESRRNELDLTLKIAEAEKQRIDSIRGLGSNFFDAALGGGKGIEQFGKSILLSQGRTIAGNAAAQLFGNVSPYLGSASKLFQGTVLGQDPLKGATDANTGATIDNSIKVAALTARLSAISLGGGASYSGATGTFSRLFGGGSTSSGGSYVNENGDDLSLAEGDFASLHPGGDYGGAPMGGGGFSSGGSTFNYGKALGIGGAIVGGGLGIYSGINTGGARGALTASASGVGAAGALLMAAGVTGPAAPILAGVGIGLGLITSLLGDPKKLRGNELNREAQSRSFSMPGGADYLVDANGNYSDYNAAGQVRKVEVTNHVYAMDSKTLTDFLLDNPGALSQGLAGAISGGNAEDTMGLIQQRVSP